MMLIVLCYFLFLLVAPGLDAYSDSSYMYNGRKVCRGLDRGLTLIGTAAVRYNEYKQRYQNCTYIDGNLELTYLSEFTETITSYNLDFLKQIEEVSGYVLIHQVCAKVIPLSNLRVVRGNTKFTYTTVYGETFSYSFYVHSNCDKPESSVEQLLLDNLAEITSGNILIENNPQLCYVNTILWSDITSSDWSVKNNSRKCGSCNCTPLNGLQRCWGPGAQHCQKFTKVNCAPQCQGSRCYGSGSRDCCPSQCAGGCNGPTARNCTACRKFNNNGECVDACPSTKRYDPQTMQNKVDPNGMLAYSTLCVKECPSFMGEEDGACVRQCSEPNKMVSNGKCIPCDGPCPKRCDGVYEPDFISLNNIRSFEGCNIVDGSIIILEASFDESEGALQFADLSVLSDVREVTGYVMIVSKLVENLNFLQNLEVIRVQIKNVDDDALYIAKTNLTSLQLRNLREIGEGGKVYIEESPMCYVQTMNWSRIIGPTYSKDSVLLGELLPSEANCSATNQVCDRRCSSEGCWGPGNGNCLSCIAYRFDKKCLMSCSESPQLYDAGNMVCNKCDPECADSCSGAGPDKCIGDCEHYKLGNTCVAECPTGTYPNDKNLCLPCHTSCQSCSGPSHFLEANGCLSCKQLKLLITPNTTACSNTSICPVGFFPTDSLNCRICDSSCRDSCYGSTNQDCFACKNFKLYAEDGKKFACIDTCPETHPHEVSDANNKQEMVCSSNPPVPLALILGTVIPLVVVTVAGIVIAAVCCKKREAAKAERTRLAAQMSGVDETQPLAPSGQPPDMAQLVLIDESELEIGKPIGNGAFGTVYRGRWKPKNDQSAEATVVAIKILQEGPLQLQQAELLQEARVMASVNNPYCLRLIGICLAAKVQLVTALMPLGSLVEYVRKNKGTRQLGSRHFAVWSLQIAKGMAYLDEKGIVHRDLAARNVLLQRPFLAKITDFGLAKLLGDEPIYESKGGKMPIKWLAIESIDTRMFTSRSDVWSYGVTLWEIYTYGQKPYEEYRARDMPDLIHRGKRLEQPPICSIDVYTIMVQCWMHEPSERPSFKDLVEKFQKIAADPTRYFVIEGDRYVRQPTNANANQPQAEEGNEWLQRLEACEENEYPDDVFESGPPISPTSMSGYSRLNNNSSIANLNHNDPPPPYSFSNASAQNGYGIVRDSSVNEYEQPTVPSYSNSRIALHNTSIPVQSAAPPPLPFRASRRSNQSGESSLSNAPLIQGPPVQRVSRNRSESNSSCTSQHTPELQTAPAQPSAAGRDRVPSNSSQPTNNPVNAPVRSSGYGQLPSRKHTSNSASSNNAPVYPPERVDSRVAGRLASVASSATSPIVGAEKRTSGIFTGSVVPDNIPEHLAAAPALYALPDTSGNRIGNHESVPMRTPYKSLVAHPGTPRTPQQSQQFQFPATVPVANSPFMDEGECLQPQKTGKPISFQKQNGNVNGEPLAQNDEYFKLPPPMPNIATVPQMPMNNNKRKSGRPPNLLLSNSSTDYPAEPTPNHVRSPIPPEQLSNLASPFAVQNMRQPINSPAYQNGDWPLPKSFVGSDPQRSMILLATNGHAHQGNLVALNIQQDSKV